MVILDKLRSGLFADVVGAVSHKSFQVDKLNRRNAVILGKFFLGVLHSTFCGVQQHSNIVANKLEGVPVPRQDIALPFLSTAFTAVSTKL